MWTIDNMSDIAVVRLNGSLDVSVQKTLKEKLQDAAASVENDIILDFEKVEFIDSSCLGVLVSVAKFLREHRGDLKIAAATEEVKSIFEITRLDRIFEMFSSCELAVESFFRRG